MDEHRYDGPEYEPGRDNPRLDSQLERVRTLMRDRQWRTLEQIAELTRDPVASISAQLRHLRKPRFGSYEVQRRHVGGGLYEYRVLEPVPSLVTYSEPTGPQSFDGDGMGRSGLAATSPYNVTED